jgi:hypothetical protein
LRRSVSVAGAGHPVCGFHGIEIATQVRGNCVEKFLLDIGHDSQNARNLCRSKESTIAPQQLSFCECHKAEKNLAAIFKPRLTRGFSSTR